MRSLHASMVGMVTCLSLCVGTPAWAQAVNTSAAIAAEPLRTVSVSGTASVFVVPDEVELRFTLTTTDRDLPKAKSANDEAAHDVLLFLERQGVATRDVQATHVTTEAIYAEQRLEGGQVTRGPLTGYNVRRDYGVTLHDVSKLAAVYDKLLPDARVTTNGHTFKSSKDREQRDAARRDAAQAAREKAKLLAEALGANLGSVRTISEGEVGPVYPMPMVNMGRLADGEGGSGSATPVGQIEVKAEVRVTFDLATDK